MGFMHADTGKEMPDQPQDISMGMKPHPLRLTARNNSQIVRVRAQKQKELHLRPLKIAGQGLIKLGPSSN